MPQHGRLNRSLQRRNEVFTVDWLLDEVVGSAAEGLNRERVLAMSGDHQGGCLGLACSDFGQQRETVHPGHLDVGDNCVVVLGGHSVEGGHRRVSRVDGHGAHSELNCLRKRL